MPSKSSDSELLADLVAHRSVDEAAWSDFWERLKARELRDGEALAVSCSLTTQLPDAATITAMLRSLRERNTRPDPPAVPTVNIVGTGGGPSTFNLSTASAFVAASIGARVIKTGSRAYASRTGSIDLLERLGVGLTNDYEQTEAMLSEFGIACAGGFLYPKELAKLARAILPFGMKQMGRFFNVIGPFLAAVPVTTQITGVSDHDVLPTFRELAKESPTARLWICSNELHCDELLSIVDSEVYDSARDETFTLRPQELGLSGGTFEELAPVTDLDATVPHFLALISGDGPTAAIESIRLNAAALALNCEVVSDWAEGLARAQAAMEAGEPARLIERLREHRAAATAAKSG